MSSDNAVHGRSSGNLVRFLNDIKDFSGSIRSSQDTSNLLNNPLSWLKKLTRLKDLARLNDKDILLVAADHLVGKAEAWFDVACKDITAWDKFIEIFTKKYCVGLEDLWWSQIRNMKQCSDESVEDVDIKLQELFALVGITDEKLKVRLFLDAINPMVAWEVERNEDLSAARDLDNVVAFATRSELVIHKYRAKGVNISSMGSGPPVVQPMEVPEPENNFGETRSTSSQSTMGELLNEFRDLKISLVKSTQGNGNFNRSRSYNCFHCNKEGHRKSDCPELNPMDGQKEKSPATGSNAIPVNHSGKNKADGVQSVGLVDYAPPAAVLAAASGSTAPLPKRRRNNNQTGNLPNEDVILNEPSRPPYLGIPPMVQPTNPAGYALGPNQALMPSTNNSRANRNPKKPRKPVRRLPITVKQSKIWDKLNSLDSGLTMGEWLVMSRDTRRDLIDGCRTLNSRYTKVSSNNGQQTLTSEVPKSKGKEPLRVGAIENWDPVANEEYDSSDLEESDGETTEYGTTTETDSLSDSDLTEYTDTSFVHYPYDLQKMKASSPLKGPVSVNGVVFDCTFDSGASVSVMSEGLARKLNLQLTGDTMELVGFDALQREPCDVAVNVPFRVAGHLRHEHMCIQKERKRNEPDYCLLGTTWFRAYGVSLNLQQHSITFPINIRRNETGEPIYDPGSPQAELQVFSTNEMDQESPLSIVAEPSVSAPSQIFAVSLAAGETSLQQLDNYMDDVYESTEGEKLEENVEPVSLTNVPDYLKDLIAKNTESFVEISGLGRVDLVEHEIPTLPDSVPTKSRPFRLSWEEEDKLTQEIEGMLELDLIHPSKGVWSSPCFFVRKKDGSLRLVIDYRRLNKATIKDNFPLPIIDSLLDSLANAQVFSTLDAASGYHQVPMHKDSMAKTGFITPRGTFEFTVMPFGLTSAPATYQRMMTNLLGEFIGKFVFVFIDDVIIYSRSHQEHAKHLELVLKRCNQANLRLKFKKCTFGAEEVEYLGHKISSKGILPNIHNTDKVLSFPTPRNPDQVRSFLGTIGYYRRFIKDYTSKTSSLIMFLRKNVRFRWGPDQEEAFKVLKQDLTTAPILAYPDREKVMILTTDASNVGVGAILSQSKTGSEEGEQVISYNSRSLRGSERNYATVHLEALAVVWGVAKYKHFLRSKRFILRTDNAALTFVMAPSKPSPKLSRWAAALLEYDFDIIHHTGKENPADALSRLLPFHDYDQTD